MWFSMTNDELMNKVIITGANGFLGRRLAEAFVKQGINVYALDCADNTLLQNKLLHYYKCDIEKNTLPLEPDMQNADTLFHFAWNGVHSDYKNDFERQLKNIPSLLNILSFAKQFNIKKTIIPGSASEYAVSEMPITGNNAAGAVDAYGSVKSACHVIARAWSIQNNLPLIWFIPSSIYGPGRDDNSILTHAIRSLLHGEKPSFTALEQRWDYIYIDDFINALILIAEYGKNGKNYSLGFGTARELREYIIQIRDFINPALPLGIGERPYRGGKPDNSEMDVSELQKDTGFVPKISFEDGIKLTIDWFKNKIQEK
jgi:nucleoside-diphosphate-sugar epimerase